MIEEEGLSANAAKMGEIYSRELSNLRPDIVLKMRGMGLFWAMVIDRKDGKSLSLRRIFLSLFLFRKAVNCAMLCLHQLHYTYTKSRSINYSCFSHRDQCMEPGLQAS